MFRDNRPPPALTGLSGVLAIALWAVPPAWADTDRTGEAGEPANSIGLALGETSGTGLMYRRYLGRGLGARANLGVIPTSSPYSNPMVFAGAGIQRELGSWAGLATHAFVGGMFKHVAINEDHYSVDPGLGLRWGPALFEVGTSFWRSFRRASIDPAMPASYVEEWGLSLAIGLGLLWDF